MTRNTFCLASLLIAAIGLPVKADDNDTPKRLEDAAVVFSEIMATPDKGIPRELLENAHCVVIVPGMKKGGLIVTAQYGKGFMTCRQGGGWSAPAAMRVEGGGVGFQIGASETDVVMVVNNARGAEKLMSSKFTIGGSGEVAAGPVGRNATAQTDAQMRAEILSWSRSRGAFAGLALNGATLRADEEDNAALYGKKMGTRDVIQSKIAPPPSASRLLTLLKQYSPRETK